MGVELIFVWCGRNGHFALWIDGLFENGMSAATPTFANSSPLCADKTTGKFECVALEIWGIQ